MNAKSRVRATVTVELVVLTTILVVVLGTAIPVISSRVETAARAQALGDVRRIAADVLNYEKDTGAWPAGSAFAFTDGEAGFGEETSFGGAAAPVHLAAFLVANKPAVGLWQGPYMSLSRPDPWGRRYVVALDGLHDSLRPQGWVISAGPDGVFQTGKRDHEPEGDDLGILLR